MQAARRGARHQLGGGGHGPLQQLAPDPEHRLGAGVGPGAQDAGQLGQDRGPGDGQLLGEGIGSSGSTAAVRLALGGREEE